MGRGVRDGESEPGVDDLGAERETVRHLRAWCSDTYLCGVGLQVLGDDVDDRYRDAAGQPQRRNDSVEVGVTEVTKQLRGRHSA
jgi:hypothetical protein